MSLRNLEMSPRGVNVPRREFVYVFARHKDRVSRCARLWMNRRPCLKVCQWDGKREREQKSASLRRWWVERGEVRGGGGMAPATFLSTRPCANSANGGLIPTQDQVEDTLLLRRQEP